MGPPGEPGPSSDAPDGAQTETGSHGEAHSSGGADSGSAPLSPDFAQQQAPSATSPKTKRIVKKTIVRKVVRRVPKKQEGGAEDGGGDSTVDGAAAPLLPLAVSAAGQQGLPLPPPEEAGLPTAGAVVGLQERQRSEQDQAAEIEKMISEIHGGPGEESSSEDLPTSSRLAAPPSPLPPPAATVPAARSSPLPAADRAHMATSSSAAQSPKSVAHQAAVGGGRSPGDSRRQGSPIHNGASPVLVQVAGAAAAVSAQRGDDDSADEDLVLYGEGEAAQTVTMREAGSSGGGGAAASGGGGDTRSAGGSGGSGRPLPSSDSATLGHDPELRASPWPTKSQIIRELLQPGSDSTSPLGSEAGLSPAPSQQQQRPPPPPPAAVPRAAVAAAAAPRAEAAPAVPPTKLHEGVPSATLGKDFTPIKAVGALPAAPHQQGLTPRQLAEASRASAAAAAAVAVASRATEEAVVVSRASLDGGADDAAAQSLAIAAQLAQLQEDSRRLQRQSLALQQRAMAMTLQARASATDDPSGSPAGAAAATAAVASDTAASIVLGGAAFDYGETEGQEEGKGLIGGDSDAAAAGANLDDTLAAAYAAAAEDEQPFGDDGRAAMVGPPRGSTPEGSETSSRGGLIWNIPSGGSSIPSPGKMGGLSPQPRSPHYPQHAAGSSSAGTLGGFSQYVAAMQQQGAAPTGTGAGWPQPRRSNPLHLEPLQLPNGEDSPGSNHAAAIAAAAAAARSLLPPAASPLPATTQLPGALHRLAPASAPRQQPVGYTAAVGAADGSMSAEDDAAEQQPRSPGGSLKQRPPFTTNVSPPRIVRRPPPAALPKTKGAPAVPLRAPVAGATAGRAYVSPRERERAAAAASGSPPKGTSAAVAAAVAGADQKPARFASPAGEPLRGGTGATAAAAPKATQALPPLGAAPPWMGGIGLPPGAMPMMGPGGYGPIAGGFPPGPFVFPNWGMFPGQQQMQGPAPKQGAVARRGSGASAAAAAAPLAAPALLPFAAMPWMQSPQAAAAAGFAATGSYGGMVPAGLAADASTSKAKRRGAEPQQQVVPGGLRPSALGGAGTIAPGPPFWMPAGGAAPGMGYGSMMFPAVAGMMMGSGAAPQSQFPRAGGKQGGVGRSQQAPQSQQQLQAAAQQQAQLQQMQQLQQQQMLGGAWLAAAPGAGGYFTGARAGMGGAISQSQSAQQHGGRAAGAARGGGWV